MVLSSLFIVATKSSSCERRISWEKNEVCQLSIPSIIWPAYDNNLECTIPESFVGWHAMPQSEQAQGPILSCCRSQDQPPVHPARCSQNWYQRFRPVPGEWQCWQVHAAPATAAAHFKLGASILGHYDTIVVWVRSLWPKLLSTLNFNLSDIATFVR